MPAAETHHETAVRGAERHEGFEPLDASPRAVAQRRQIDAAYGPPPLRAAALPGVPVVQRDDEEDRKKANGYIELIEHEIDQDNEEAADDHDDPVFHSRLLSTLPAKKIIEIWEEGQVREFIEQVSPQREKKLATAPYGAAVEAMTSKGVDIAIARHAVLFVLEGQAPDEPPKPLLIKAAQIALLYSRVDSVLTHGVLSPAELRKRKIVHTSSSDTSAQDHISAFDIDMDRNADEHYDERFPFPGHQSVSPVLERQNDISDLAGRMLEAARNKREVAVKHVQTIQQAEHDTQPLDKFIETIAQSPKLMRELGMRARFDSGGMNALAVRAANSAMIISSGEQLEKSKASAHLKKPITVRTSDGPVKKDSGPRVAELRAPTSIEPKDVTHVLLPDFMEGFPPLKNWEVPVVFVGTVATQVGYYDEASRVQMQVQLPIPDFQGAIDTIVAKGTRKLLTHITNV